MAVTSPNGDIIGGWSLEPEQIRIGLTRLLFPYMAGMLLRRAIRLINIKHAFAICSLLLILVLSFPRVGGYENLWANGLYDSLVVIFVFPIIIYLGAAGEAKTKLSDRLCNFLGDISYPIYIIHFPFTYVFYAWVTENDIPIQIGLLYGIGLLIFTTVLAYASLKLFDEPIRKWLARRFMATNK